MLVPIIYSWVSQLIDAYWLIEHCYPYETGTSPMLFPTACPFKPPCVKDLPLLRLIKTWYFWLVVEPTPLKNDGVRQWGWWHSQLNGKLKNVPNHQPVLPMARVDPKVSSLFKACWNFLRACFGTLGPTVTADELLGLHVFVTLGRGMVYCGSWRMGTSMYHNALRLRF